MFFDDSTKNISIALKLFLGISLWKFPKIVSRNPLEVAPKISPEIVTNSLPKIPLKIPPAVFENILLKFQRKTSQTFLQKISFQYFLEISLKSPSEASLRILWKVSASRLPEMLLRLSEFWNSAEALQAAPMFSPEIIPKSLSRNNQMFWPEFWQCPL